MVIVNAIPWPCSAITYHKFKLNGEGGGGRIEPTDTDGCDTMERADKSKKQKEDNRKTRIGSSHLSSFCMYKYFQLSTKDSIRSDTHHMPRTTDNHQSR